MNPFVFDIETGPRPDAEAWLPPIEAPANYKDPAKIEAYLAEKKATALERAALSAETGRVLCVGLFARERFDCIAEDDEATLLRITWEQLAAREANDVFVTFNGARFDWPFLVRRSYLLGVPVPDWMPRDGRWKPRQHVDLMELWQCGDRQESVSLDRLARLCGLPGKTDTGASFAAHWAADRAKALEYLRKDLELTRDLFLRMVGDLDREPASETPQDSPTTKDLIEAIKDALTQRYPSATPEDKAGRIEVIREVFGCPWTDVQKMAAADLRPRLVALKARLGIPAVNVLPPPAEEPDEIPMAASPAATPTPQPAAPAAAESRPREEVREKAEAAPACAGEPEVAAAFAAELRKALGSDENIRLAIGWMVRNKWITGQQATMTDPLLCVPQAKAEKALGAMPRFLTAIGAKEAK